jgi:hypothetical protein
MRFGAVLGAALAVTVLLSSGAPPAGADDKDIAKLAKNGHLSIPSAHGKTPASASPGKTVPAAHPNPRRLQLIKTLYHHEPKVVQARNLSTKQLVGSKVTIVDGTGLPAGFGKDFFWDRKDEAIVLVMFLNSADNLGASISNLKAGDTIQVTSAAGTAGFSKDTGHPLLSSIVGLLAAGAKAVLDANGDSAFDPVVTAAENLAKDQFKGTGAAQQIRNAFGVAEDGGFALEEGGVIVCMPQAQGPYYSADHDHRDHWASQPPKGSGRRGLPKYLQGTSPNPPSTDPFHFLSQSEPNVFTCTQDGEAYLLAWDQPGAFGDNTGFYKVFVHISQPSTGSGSGGPPIFKKEAKKAPPKSPKDK